MGRFHSYSNGFTCVNKFKGRDRRLGMPLHATPCAWDTTNNRPEAMLRHYIRSLFQ